MNKAKRKAISFGVREWIEKNLMKYGQAFSPQHIANLKKARKRYRTNYTVAPKKYNKNS